ncbi:hypothetical protein SISSUDRAFT_1052754 [Sistotremastrum suecicum HHB10207 ss-3]|uniref:F-box domain-containing protein n=1 Tax=Sistotremastrum suecicum HHB10207 ss-3 TaxID=1314776 RepID=A0A165ZMU2_9AGAM|nr:hypothetical protein SISSUDRAFT_1052754 [Sistotremastrum suecicum HHB10207 ss-3]
MIADEQVVKGHQSIQQQPTGLLLMAPELLLKILHGLCLKDIVNIAQTCLFLRSLVISNKAGVMGAYDQYALDLPLGCPIDDLPGALLYELACRFNATSLRLGRAQGPLQSVQEELVDLKFLGLEWRPDHCFRHFFQRGDIFAFRSGTVIIILKLGRSSVLKRHVKLDLGPDPFHQVDYQLIQEGRSLLIAYASSNFTEHSETMDLHVKEVDITEKAFGEMTTHLKIAIPDNQTTLVTIRDPYLVAICSIGPDGYNNYLVDWRKQTLMLFDILRPGESQSIEMGMAKPVLDISEIIFHPEEAMMIVFYHPSDEDQRCRIHLCRVDIPLGMTSIAQDGLIQPSHLSHHTVESRGVLTTLPESLSESPFVLSVLSVGLRSLSGLSWVMDVIIHANPRHTRTPHVQTDKHDDTAKSYTSRLSIDLSNWTSAITALDNSMLYSYDRVLNHSILPRCERAIEQIQGTPFFVVERSGQVEVFIPKFENGEGHEPCWVSLVLPGPNLNPTPNSESSQTVLDAYLWKSLLCLFNVQTGKLYACFGKYLCVVQL